MAVLVAVGATLGRIGMIVGIGATIASFFKNKNPQRDHDSNLANQVTELGFQIWQAVSGEDRRSITAGTSSLVGPDRGSNYPNVPKGPGGDLNIDIEAAMAQLNTTLTSAAAQLVLAESRSNPAFSNGAGGAMALLQAVKAYRAAHPVATLASTGNLKVAGGLGLGVAGLYLLKGFF